jgi:hypothetical protein
MGSCSGGNGGPTSHGPANVHTKKDTTNWNGFALSNPEPAFATKTARGAVEVRNSSGSIRARVSYRYTEDGITFGSWTPLYTAGTQEQTNDGLTQPDSSADVTANAKRLIPWGVEVKNDAGTSLEAAVVTVQIETRSW